MQYMVYTHPHLPCENFKCTSPLLPFYLSSGDVSQLLLSYDRETLRPVLRMSILDKCVYQSYAENPGEK